MANASVTRAGRTLVVVLRGPRRALRARRARRLVEARAGPRPPGRHPHHPDRQGRRTTARPTSRRRAGSSTSASTAPVSPRPRSPPRATASSWSRSPARAARPGRDRQAAGAAAVPRRRAERRRHGRARPPSSSAEPSGLPSEPLVTVAPSETATPKPASPQGQPVARRSPPRPDPQEQGAVHRRPAGRVVAGADARGDLAAGGVRERSPTDDASTDADRHGDPVRRGGGRPRRPAAVDAQPGREVAGGVQRLHLPGARSGRPRSTTTRTSRWSPVTSSGRSTCSPRRMIEGTRAQGRQPAPAHPDERRVRRQPAVQRPRLRRVRADLRRALRHRAAVRHRARRRGHLGADHERADPRRQGRDHRRLHRGRGRQPGDQPEVRRAADPVPGRPAGRDRRPVARRQPALGRASPPVSSAWCW